MASKDTPMSIDDIFKSCSHTDDKDKIKLLAAKYEELILLYRSQETTLNATKRELASVTNDKNKQLLARSRLEGCCRQLQKDNIALKVGQSNKIPIGNTNILILIHRTRWRPRFRNLRLSENISCKNFRKL